MLRILFNMCGTLYLAGIAGDAWQALKDSAVSFGSWVGSWVGKLIAFIFGDMFRSAIKSNLMGIFEDVNAKVSMAGDVLGQTPNSWNGTVFNIVKNINGTVVIPIAGMILTAVLCFELIQMIVDRNNFNDGDTFPIFKFVLKAWCSIWFVTHAFDFIMAAFDIAQYIIGNVTGLVTSQQGISNDQIMSLMQSIEQENNVGILLQVLVEVCVIRFILFAVAACILIAVYGRFFEIYVYSSVASIPFATLGNKEWGQIGTNYIKGIFALGLQGVFMMIAIGIYATLIKNVPMDNLHTFLLMLCVLGVLLCKMLFSCGSLAKSVMNAH